MKKNNERISYYEKNYHFIIRNSLTDIIKELVNYIRLSECVDIVNKILLKSNFSYGFKDILNHGVNDFLEDYDDYVEGDCKKNFKLCFYDLSDFINYMGGFVNTLYTVILLENNDIIEIVNDIIVYCKFNEGVKDLIISAVKYELCEE